jgi:hypothetical protein
MSVYGLKIEKHQDLEKKNICSYKIRANDKKKRERGWKRKELYC